MVKANAYGLGVEPVRKGALGRRLPRSFSSPLPAEGAALRAVLPEAYIYILAGLFRDRFGRHLS